MIILKDAYGGCYVKYIVQLLLNDKAKLYRKYDPIGITETLQLNHC